MHVRERQQQQVITILFTFQQCMKREGAQNAILLKIPMRHVLLKGSGQP